MSDKTRSGGADFNVGVRKWEEEEAAKMGMSVVQAEQARLQKKNRTQTDAAMRVYWVSLCMWLTIGDTVMDVWINEHVYENDNQVQTTARLGLLPTNDKIAIFDRTP